MTRKGKFLSGGWWLKGAIRWRNSVFQGRTQENSRRIPILMRINDFLNIIFIQ